MRTIFLTSEVVNFLLNVASAVTVYALVSKRVLVLTSVTVLMALIVGILWPDPVLEVQVNLLLPATPLKSI